MRRTLFVIITLTLVLASCQSPANQTVEGTTTAVPSLPDTWTPVPTAVPSQPYPSLKPQLSPSPTPTNPPPTQPQPTVEVIVPSLTAAPTQQFPALQTGVDLTIVRIQMETTEYGWAVGFEQEPYYRILTTADGGWSWQDRTPPAVFSDLNYIREDDTAAFFWDEKTAWVLFGHELRLENLGSHVVWRTTDGGLTWLPSDPLPFPWQTLFITPAQFYFIDNQQGWLWSHNEYSMMHDFGYLFSTQDGGQTWALANTTGDSMIEALWNTEMAFADEKYGWMLKDSLGGFTPFIEITQDGGQTWEWIDLPAPEGEWEVIDRQCAGADPQFEAASRTGNFLLNCAPAKEAGGYDLEQITSYLYSSRDSGLNWEIQQLPAQVAQLVMRKDGAGYAFGKDHYRTQDGGASWQLIKTVKWQGDFSLLSPQLIWAVARNGEQIELVYSDDGGKTYQIIQPVATD